MPAKKAAKKAAKKEAPQAEPPLPPAKKAAKKAPKKAAKKAAAPKAKAAVPKPPVPKDVAKAAYLNSIARQEQGLPPDPVADWLEAEKSEGD